MVVQSLVNFEFLGNKKQYVRLKRSSYTPAVFLVYVIINELNYLLLKNPINKIVLDVSTIALMAFVLIRD